MGVRPRARTNIYVNASGGGGGMRDRGRQSM